MKTSQINQYISTVREVCGHLYSNQGALNAYPAMQPILVNIASGLDYIAHEHVRMEVETAICGDAPWAKLYKMQTGNEILIPRELGLIKDIGQSEQYQKSFDRPLRDIIAYWMDKSGLEVLNYNFAIPSSEGAGTLAIIDITIPQGRYGEATISFPNNDMTVTLPDLHSPTGEVSCPLFSEPYVITVNMEWMIEHILQPLYSEFVPTPVTVVDKDMVLDDSCVDEDKAAALAKILQAGEYRGPGGPYRATVALSDLYRVVLSKRDRYWSDEPLLKVSEISRRDSAGQWRNIHDWHKNSPLVIDLMESINVLIERALLGHTESTSI